LTDASRDGPGLDAISFTDPEIQVCPFETYRRLHADRRVHRDPVTGFWEVLRYEDQRAIAQNPALYSSEHMLYGEKTHSPAYEEMKRMYEEEGYPNIPTLINADEPVHRKNRNLVDASFRAPRVKALEPYIRELVVKLIDDWGDASEVEFMAQFALLLPLYVISDTIGVPRDRALDFKRWSDALIAVTDPAKPKDEQIALTRVVIEMHRFFAEAYEAAREAPGENILGDLVRGEIDGQPVSTRLAVHLLSSILVAGNETTTAMLGSAMLRLIETPGLEEMLRAAPERIPDFIEESLRLEAPLPCQFRRNVEEVAFDDAVIPKDSLIVLRFGAGNRDPHHYPEPDAFDIERGSLRQHLTFGSGIHMCVGHLLARAELRIAFEELLMQFRNFALLGEPRREPSYIAYGPRTLPIRFHRP